MKYCLSYIKCLSEHQHCSEHVPWTPIGKMHDTKIIKCVWYNDRAIVFYAALSNVNEIDYAGYVNRLQNKFQKYKQNCQIFRRAVKHHTSWYLIDILYSYSPGNNNGLIYLSTLKCEGNLLFRIIFRRTLISAAKRCRIVSCIFSGRYASSGNDP